MLWQTCFCVLCQEVITHERVVAMMKTAIRDTQDLPMFVSVVCIHSTFNSVSWQVDHSESKLLLHFCFLSGAEDDSVKVETGRPAGTGELYLLQSSDISPHQNKSASSVCLSFLLSVCLQPLNWSLSSVNTPSVKVHYLISPVFVYPHEVLSYINIVYSSICMLMIHRCTTT